MGEVLAMVAEPELVAEEEDPFGGLKEVVAIRKILLENGWWSEEVSRAVQRHAGAVFFSLSLWFTISFFQSARRESLYLPKLWKKGIFFAPLTRLAIVSLTPNGVIDRIGAQVSNLDLA